MYYPNDRLSEKRVFKRFATKTETSVLVRGSRIIRGFISDLSFDGIRIEYCPDDAAAEQHKAHPGSPVNLSLEDSDGLLHALPATIMYDVAAPADAESASRRICALRFDNLSSAQALALNRLFA